MRIAALFVLALGLCGLAMPAFAQGPGWVVNVKVVRLVSVADGGINVRFSPDLTGCVPLSGYSPWYGYINWNHPGVNRMKADLLYAFATDALVSVYLNNNTCLISEMALGGTP